MTDPRTLVTELLQLCGLSAGGDEHAAREVDEAMGSAQGGGVPEVIRTSGHALVRSLACQGSCRRGGKGCERARRCELLEELRAINEARLSTVADFLTHAGMWNGSPPVVLGDAAVLLGLYQDLGAFRGQLWIFGVPGKNTGSEDSSDAIKALSAPPSDLKLKRRGPLRDFVGSHTFREEAAGHVWEVPKDELLITALAARVGDPDATPLPPVWAHLCVALVKHRNDLDMELVHHMAQHLELNGKVERGLAVAARILPTLEDVVGVREFDIPLWERILAIPISARRLMSDAMNENN